MRNRATARRTYNHESVGTTEFECGYEGAWQRIPDDVQASIEAANIDVIIKFGMSLLRIDGVLAEVPVLSYHHGDPSRYRGRPAGFYELLENADKSGVIVQRLSNKLDAGEVYAIAHSRLAHHSYKATAINFYTVSKYLLRRAVINLQERKPLPAPTDGRIYRLPSNLTVLRFAILLASRKIGRILYGMFFEKQWRVATTALPGSVERDQAIRSSELAEIPMSRGYRFYADPFFSADGKFVRLEALGSRNGLGDIVEVSVTEPTRQRCLLTGHHYSYPFSFVVDGREVMLPEVASHSSPYITAGEPGGADTMPLRGFEDRRIVDGTIVVRDGRYYLFYSDDAESSSVLRLAAAERLDGPYTEHPASPICIDPDGARMGGRLIETEQGMLRLGQRNCRDYGDGLNVFRIGVLTPERYEETLVSSISMADHKGPHTLDIAVGANNAVLDFYDEKFSVLAGYRRFMARIAKK